MTLQELQQTATSRTEAIIGAWTDRPTGQTKKVIDEYRTAYMAMDKQLKNIHAKLLSGVKPEDYYNEMIKFQRLEKLQKQIAVLYRDAARAAGFKQIEISKTGISNQYYGNMYSINWFAGSQKNQFFTVLNKNVVDVSVLSTPRIWDRIKADHPKQIKDLQKYQPRHGTLIDTLNSNKTDDLLKIKQTLTQSLLQGKSYTKTAQELKKIMNTSATNAVRIARTEGIRNMNAGALANTQAAMDAGVDVGRKVLEHVDGTTRKQSLAINGQRQKGVDPFDYPNLGPKGTIGVGTFKVNSIGNSGVKKYDINERGTSVDFVEGIEPNTVKGMNPVTGTGETADYSEFNTWMKDNDLIFSDTGRIVSKGKTAF